MLFADLHEVGGASIRVTPSSPLGGQLSGQTVGVVVRTPGGVRLTLVEIDGAPGEQPLTMAIQEERQRDAAARERARLVAAAARRKAERRALPWWRRVLNY